MVAVVLVSKGLATEGLESLLKAAGWAAQSSPEDAHEWDFEGKLKAILGAPGDRNAHARTALITTVDVLSADRAVEEILGQCIRVRVILVAPDSMNREERRAVLRALRSGADDFVAASAVPSEIARTTECRPRARPVSADAAFAAHLRSAARAGGSAGCVTARTWCHSPRASIASSRASRAGRGMRSRAAPSSGTWRADRGP